MTFAEMVEATENNRLEVNLHMGGTEVETNYTYWGVLHLDTPSEYRRPLNDEHGLWASVTEVCSVVTPQIIADVWAYMILGDKPTEFGPALIALVLGYPETTLSPPIGEGEVELLWVHKSEPV